MNEKSDSAYKTIGEIAKELGLINSKSGNLNTHTIRYWQTQFKQIKPKIMAGNRRYYSEKDFKIVKNIKYLLKDKGLTIKGVKKFLNKKTDNNLDEVANIGSNLNDLKTKEIKKKLKNISKIIKDLKK